MSKIGVGVGEDFPVDDADGNKGAGAQEAQNGGADDRTEFEAWKRRRDDERRYYEDKHRRHEEWHQRKQEFKDRIKAAARDLHHDARDYEGRDHERGHDRDWHGRGWHFGRFWPMGIGIALLVLTIPVLIIALFFSLISAAFKAPFVILAIVAIAALFFTLHHRRGHHRFGYSGHGHRGHGHYRYYTEDDIQSPPRPQQPQQNGTPPVITPTPPATGE